MDRIEWDDRVYDIVAERLEVSRGDAQAIARDDLLDVAFLLGADPEKGADYIIAMTVTEG